MTLSMAARIFDIAKYSPKSGEVFFFDNCIWMYLFCPMGNLNKANEIVYSRFLKSILTSNATIFINSLILSEFANRYLRLDFDLFKKEQLTSISFKQDYVGTSRYKTTVDDINSSINNILKLCEKSSDNFHCIDIDKVLKHFKSIDFNDSYIIELSTLNKYKLVTDDKDFIKYGMHNIEVITKIC